MVDDRLIQKIVNEVIAQLSEPMTTKMEDKGEEETIVEGYEDRLLVPSPKDEKAYLYMKNTTPARIGVWRAGQRPLTETLIKFRADHALAVDAVFSMVDEEWVKSMGWISLKTKVDDKDQHLTRPDLGRELSDESKKEMNSHCIHKPRVQIIISDGLSAKAVTGNLVELLPAFMQGLSLHGIETGTPVFVKFGRVGVMDSIGEDIGAEAAIIFIGERPGLMTAESLSAYMIYNPRRGATESERTVLSNIHSGGTPAMEAGAHLATIIDQILNQKSSGINLER